MGEQRRRWSLRARITAVASAVVAALLGIGAVSTVWLLDRVLTDQIASQLSEEIEAIDTAVAARGPAAIAEQDDGVLIVLHGTGGTVVNDDAARALPDPGTVRGRAEVTIDEDSMIVVAGSTDAGPVVVARSAAEVKEAVAAATTVLAVAVPIAVALIAVIMWFVVARALGPVDRMRRRVDAIGVDSLDQRVPRTGRGDEIDSLAATMNRMLGRVEAGYRSRQRFVSDASHELRSPLATVRQYAELTRGDPDSVLADELAEVVLDEGARMQEIVEGLLLLARLDEGALSAATASDVDLDDIVFAEVSRLRGVSGLTVDGRGITPARVRGDKRLLARVARNLVDNAMRHARGRVTLSVGVKRGYAILCVDDDGAGVPEADRERVFERFTRLDEARSRDAGGSGLGLAIVSEIVRAHGGSVRVEASPLGGARFAVFLPTVEEPRL